MDGEARRGVPVPHEALAPIQPLIGAASVILLATTLLWRLNLRENGGACPI